MFLYPDNIESKLGFDKIKELLADYCSSELGLQLVQEMELTHHPARIRQLLNQTHEQKKQLESGDGFPELQAYAVDRHLEHARVSGYQLTAAELYEIKLDLELAVKCAQYHLKYEEEYPLWFEASQQVPQLKELIASMTTVLDDHGEIRDGASPELKRLRKKIQQGEFRVRKSLESILGTVRSQGYTEKESSLTLRDGRLVVPMHAEHKRRIPGMVVDESATGKTVYVEPMEVFNINNDIRELQFAEKREINRILLELTQQVAPHNDEIQQVQQYLGFLDFTRAKAMLGRRLRASLPRVLEGGGIDLKQARHPLLQLAHDQLKMPVVPLDIQLDPQLKVIVISGPNAGGKSVCLKTVGLLQLMGQSGLLIPADEGSCLGSFQKIFVDIGDEQSIENDLSTYSSHLRNMHQFVKEADENSLFLIDEFGTGTEPQFGGPIAEAILEYLVGKKSFGLVTTHYGNLKKFAERTSGVDNAAMRFDLEALEPLYQLETGRPGSSFALEIAAKTGLSPSILQKAKENIGADPVAFEKLVSQLEQSKLEHSRALQELQTSQLELTKKQQHYQQLVLEFKEQKKKLLNEAKLQAQNLLKETNQKIEATIRAIKESKADSQITKKARKELKTFEKATRIKVQPAAENRKLSGPVKVGDLVLIEDTGAEGEVISISGNWAEVLLGDLKSKVKLDRLHKTGKVAPTVQKSARQPGIALYQKRTKYRNELDVRGMRAEQALKEVTNFVDEGSMLGIKDLKIIHGRGDGILRQLIRKYLHGEPTVAQITDESTERGGDGVTLISLK